MFCVDCCSAAINIVVASMLRMHATSCLTIYPKKFFSGHKRGKEKLGLGEFKKLKSPVENSVKKIKFIG